MFRELNLFLNAFDPIPESLTASSGVTLTSIEINIISLLSHMYWDNYGTSPITPNPLVTLYAELITQDKEFRFKGNGLGIDPEIKRIESCKFGRAFCRWFLTEHCATPYFTSLNKVLKREIVSGSDVWLERVGKGNTPDYICHIPEKPTSFESIFFAEAKGGYKSLNFSLKGKFKKWREQVENVHYVHGKTKQTYYSKAYIVATRFANQDQQKTSSEIWAEDPNSSGTLPFSEETSEEFIQVQRMIKAGHYANIMERLNLPEVAQALMQNTLLPTERRFRVGIWRGRTRSILNEDFVGGYISLTSNFFNSPSSERGEDFQFNRDDTGVIFVGLHRKIFYLVRQITISGREAADDLFPNIVRGGLDDEISVLPDGTVMGPLSSFEFSSFSDE